MARPGRTESDSVSIWLKLSEEDAARMTQVLARPEFAGWTRAEWCLEMIQTALGYYTRPRPAAGPARESAEPAAGAEPAVGAEPAAGAERGPAAGPAEEPAPERPLAAAEPVPAETEPGPEVPVAPEFPAGELPVEELPVEELLAEEPEPEQADCPHPADARDYQSGTCAACGAILWD